MSDTVVLLAGANGDVGAAIARAVLLAGGKVAAAVTRDWQVAKVREQLLEGGVDPAALLVGLVAPRDAEAAAGFVKGATDALGPISHVAGASFEQRSGKAGREPAGDLDDLLEINLHTNATLARAALPAMRRRKSGTLVFAKQPARGDACSTTCMASFAAMGAFADALRPDVQAASVRIETVAADCEPAEWLSLLQVSAGAS